MAGRAVAAQRRGEGEAGWGEDRGGSGGRRAVNGMTTAGPTGHGGGRRDGDTRARRGSERDHTKLGAREEN